MSWLTLLPYAVQLISYLLTKANAKQDTINKFNEFVKAAQGDGLISITAKDEFKKLDDELNKK